MRICDSVAKVYVLSGMTVLLNNEVFWWLICYKHGIAPWNSTWKWRSIILTVLAEGGTACHSRGHVESASRKRAQPSRWRAKRQNDAWAKFRAEYTAKAIRRFHWCVWMSFRQGRAKGGTVQDHPYHTGACSCLDGVLTPCVWRCWELENYEV